MQTARSVHFRWLTLAELALIVWVALTVQPEYRDFSPTLRIRGSEYSYLVNSGIVAGDMLRAYGRIPLWNPLMGMAGEPLIENPFSFVLNPFMSVPIFVFGAVNGPKVALLLHMIGFGFGGWLLAYSLRLGWAGRLLLGLLLVGSGSFVGPIGEGFYQMALSQCYVPWIMAGLIGTLYRRSHWPVALLAIAGTLMIFAGTFWYVLPTAITAALIVAGAAIRWQGRRLGIDGHMLRRVGLAAAFTFGLAAASLIPLLVHRHLVEHPIGGPDPVHPLGYLMLRYVSPERSPVEALSYEVVDYHYVLPLAFAILIVLARSALMAANSNSGWPRRPERRILIPGIAAFFLFTLWGQGYTPILQAVFSVFPILREWRFLTRFMAAASPWLVVLAACGFDDVVSYLGQRAARAVWPMRLAMVGLIGYLVMCGALAVQDVGRNYLRVAGTEQVSGDEAGALRFLRDSDTGFLTVLGDSFFAYLPYYETRIRAAFGNPDYRPGHLANTFGPDALLELSTPYRTGFQEWFPAYMREQGYAPRAGAPVMADGTILVWHKDSAPDYAFVVGRAVLESRWEQLTRGDTLPVSYVHQFDRVLLEAADYPPGALLVAQEMAYPGWEVWVNDQPAPLEVVGGRIAARLPDLAPAPNQPPTRVAFAYRPGWLYVGMGITLLGAAALCGYLLKGRRSGHTPE